MTHCHTTPHAGTGDDERHMALALDLASRAWGMTSPNPMVGAVVAAPDGTIVGRGYHHGPGLPHAEPNALRDAAGHTQGATLYVTLEPCCTYGRTPPCTQAILNAGIARVVVGCLDPNPRHAGRGIDLLRQAGVTVDCGVLERPCRDLNRAFFHWITTGRPYVLLKMAMTLDGRIATRTGDSQWITGPEARAHVQRLRQAADAIMVGGETARLDRPSLLVRKPHDWPRQPQRLVWTSRPIPPDAPMLHDGGPRPRRAKPVSAPEWRAFLNQLGADGIMTLLLEGGGELAGVALRAHAVDEVAFFIAPKLLTGRDSRPVVGGDSPLTLAEALDLHDVELRPFGPDILYSAKLGAPPQPGPPTLRP